MEKGLKSILFVCLGNICRSPTAEAIMRTLIEYEGLERQFMIDSAGTSGFHAGEQADSRSRSHAKSRGVEITSISRQVRFPDDFEEFDYIVAMDSDNLTDLQNMDRESKYHQKILLITDFLVEKKYDGIPDPYYSGDKGFELVFDLLEEACQEFLEFAQK